MNRNALSVLLLILAHRQDFRQQTAFCLFFVQNLARSGGVNAFRVEQDVLTEQVAAGDASLGDSGLHGADSRGEDV